MSQDRCCLLRFARAMHMNAMLRCGDMRDGDNEYTGYRGGCCTALVALMEDDGNGNWTPKLRGLVRIKERVCDKSVIAEVLGLRLTCLFLSARFTRTPRPPQHHPT